MKLLSRISFRLSVVVSCILLLQCCKKQPFQDGVGLYSEKQYHSYSISSPGDTTQLANAIITTVSMTNNYLSWNNITFYQSATSDTLQTYVHDTAINGGTVFLYNLNYYPKTDEVVVIGNPVAIIGNNVSRIWRSF